MFVKTVVALVESPHRSLHEHHACGILKLVGIALATNLIVTSGLMHSLQLAPTALKYGALPMLLDGFGVG